MKTLDWLNNEIIANGLLCDEYIKKVRCARSKKQLFEICADANGVSFLMEMREKGFPLDYETIWEDFERYINGKYKPEFETDNGSYTSAIYCQANEVKDINVDTTVAAFLSCINEVHIEPFLVTKLVVDQNCALRVFCPDSSRAYIDVYGEGEVDIIEGKHRVTIRRK